MIEVYVDNGIPIHIQRTLARALQHECVDYLRSNGYDGTHFFYRCQRCGAEYTGEQVDAMHDAALAAEERAN